MIRFEKLQNALRLSHSYVNVVLWDNLRARKCLFAFKKTAPLGLIPDSLSLGNAAHGIVNHCAVTEAQHSVAATAAWRISVFRHQGSFLPNEVTEFSEPSPQ